jgi:hypothetical protein
MVIQPVQNFKPKARLTTSLYSNHHTRLYPYYPQQ